MTVDPGTNILGADGLRVGDLILFSNANGNALQMITRTDGTQTVFFDVGDALNLNQPGAAQGNLIGIQSNPGVFPPTTATRVMMISYYVDVVTDPTLPRLVRQVNNGPRLAIALGVENLQFSYDLVDGTVESDQRAGAAGRQQPESDSQGEPLHLGAIAGHGASAACSSSATRWRPKSGSAACRSSIAINSGRGEREGKTSGRILCPAPSHESRANRVPRCSCRCW